MADNQILLGGSDGTQIKLDAGMANRHCLITGATGTGKTVTLQILAEGFSKAGVPVFLSDVKGDLSGLAQAGSGLRNAIRIAESGKEELFFPSVAAATQRALSVLKAFKGTLDILDGDVIFGLIHQSSKNWPDLVHFLLNIQWPITVV